MSEPRLSPRLMEILGELPDRVFASGLERALDEAAAAIGDLQTVEMISYESMVGDGSADLSLWEAMAPVVGGTLVRINAFLSAARALVGNAPVAEDEDEPLVEPPQDDRVKALLRQSVTQFSSGVAELGERIRRPEVVADRWNVQGEVQSFRTRFREQLSSLVFDIATIYADVSRRDVVPDFDREVKSAGTVRGTIADLRRLLRTRKQKIQEAQDADLPKLGQDLIGEMDLFGRTEAYKLLRAQDKRTVIDMRTSLRDLLDRSTPDQGQLCAVIDRYLEFCDVLSKINDREFLINHDREVWAALGVELEQAELLSARDTTGSARHFSTAVTNAQALYGKDSALDGFLRRMKRMSIGSLDSRDLRTEIDKFREHLSNLPMY